MERAPVLADLIARAAAGDHAAVGTVLAQLASGDAEEQLSTLRSLYPVANAGFWTSLLQHLASGLRHGQTLAKGSASPQSIDAARLRIRALFIYGPSEGPGNRARQEALLRGLASPDASIRRVSADLAGSTGDNRFLEPLSALARDDHDHVQMEAVRSLGKLRDPRAIPVLVDLLSSEDSFLATIAQDALIMIGAPAVEALIGALDETGANEQQRWMAARALGRLGDPRAVEALVGHLGDSNYGVRWAVADALIDLDRAAISAVLRALMTHEVTPWVADAAARIMQHARPLETKEILKPVLEALRGVDARWLTPVAAADAKAALEAKQLI